MSNLLHKYKRRDEHHVKLTLELTYVSLTRKKEEGFELWGAKHWCGGDQAAPNITSKRTALSFIYWQIFAGLKTLLIHQFCNLGDEKYAEKGAKS